MASAESVSPFFTTTRVPRGLEATVFDFVEVLAVLTVVEVLGLADVDDVTEAVRDLAELPDGDDALGSDEGDEAIGVKLLGGVSFAANNDASSPSGEASREKIRRFHLEGLSAQAST